MFDMFETILIILEQSLINFPLILGAYISISLMKLPDLSIESAYVFAALTTAKALHSLQFLPSGIALLILISISIMSGALVGLISSLLAQKSRIPYLLASIITVGIFHGMGQLLIGVYVPLSSYKNMLVLEWIPFHPELPLLMTICLICICIAFYFFKTALGYCIAAFGNNSSFFTHYGISTLYIFIAGIMAAHACAGLSGYLCAQSNGFADISMGINKLLLCITVLILGKLVPLKKASFIIPLVGTLIYFSMQQLLLKIGFDLRYFTMIQALVIVIILIIQHRKRETIHSDHLGV